MKTLLLALALLVLGTGTAQAVTITEYDVTIEGEATYARNQAYPVPYGFTEEHQKAAFKWKTHFPSVTFIDKHVGVSGIPTTTVTDIDASLYVSIPTPEGPKTGGCTGSALSAPPSPGWFGAGVMPTPDPNVEALGVRVIGGVGFLLPNCTGIAAGGGAQSFSIGSGAESIPLGPWDHEFDMPHEAIGMGKIIQLLDANVTGRDCPGTDEYTASCALTWKATVTFVRKAKHGGTVPKPPKPPVTDPPLLTTPPKASKLRRTSKRAKVKLTCRVACSGTATLMRGSHRLARVRFTAEAGEPETVVLRLKPKAQRELHRAQIVRIELRVTPEGGGTAVRRTLLVKLRR
jgi:hypothetical protein